MTNTDDTAGVVPPRRVTRFSGAWLMQQQFPPVSWIVKGLIPEGLTIISAAPKVGKSWLSLAVAIYVATGVRPFEVIDAQPPRPVLYFALEDGPRRLQARATQLGMPVPDNLEFITELQGGNALQIAADFVSEHQHEQPFIILDTLGKALPAPAGTNAYRADYQQISLLKNIADYAEGGGMLVVHHNRKMGATDFVEEMSGTAGITGAADTLLSLKRDRNATDGVLHLTSRDTGDGEYALTFTDGRWDFTGGSLEAAADAARDVEATQGVGDDMALVVREVGKHPDGIGPTALSEALGMEAAKVRQYLKRAFEAGRIKKAGRGVYTPVTSVTLSLSGACQVFCVSPPDISWLLVGQR